MITAEAIKSANERVKKIEIGKGNQKKFYTSVAARVAAFREMCATGTIVTEIVTMADGVVTMKATVSDEAGRVLATGMAQEKESSSFINKTSYIENCETSAVGRALGMLGIGSDEQMASAEELANAINNQNNQSQQNAQQTAQKSVQQNRQQTAPQQTANIPPVTNETVRRAYQQRPQETQQPQYSQQPQQQTVPQQNAQQTAQEQQPDTGMNELCNDIELASIEAIVHKLWPRRSIESIFGAWPNVTKGQYAEFNQTIRDMQNRGK